MGKQNTRVRYAVGTVDCHFVTSTHTFPSLQKTCPGSNFVTRTELPTLFLGQKLLPGDVFYRLGNAPKSFLVRTPLGVLTALPHTLYLVGGGWPPPPQESHTRLGPSGLGLRPYGPRCLVAQTPPKINPSYGLEHMHYVIHLMLANDSFKCDRACVSWLEFSIQFNFLTF